MATGRRPAPTNVKLLRGDRTSRIPDAEPVPRTVDPEPPEWATESWLAIWTATVTELRHLGILYAAEQAAIVALVTAIHEYERLAKVLVGAPAVTRSEKGTPETNPLGRALRPCSAEVSRWASHFGLSRSE